MKAKWTLPLPHLKRAALLLLAAVTAALGGCVEKETPARIQVDMVDTNSTSRQMSREEIIQGARLNPELMWYTSAPEAKAEEFLTAFREEYPFIVTHLRRASTFDTMSRLDDEVMEQSVKADVVHVLDVSAFIDLQNRGELLPYQSAEESAIRPNFRSDKHWWAMRLVAIGMAYNSEKLAPGEAPETWEDLLGSRFTGRLGLKDAATGGSAYAQYYLLRERLGTLFWERVASQHPRINRSEQELKQQLLDGDIDVAGQMVGYKILDAQANGEPIVGVWPKEGVPLIPGPVAILAQAPHREAAMLFIDFALSKKGQERFRDLLMTYSARTDVHPLPNQPPLGSLNLLTPLTGWGDYGKNQTELRTEFETMFRPGGE